MKPITLFSAAVILGMMPSLQAATFHAASCNQTDVQNAIFSAHDGDTVLVPAGTCAWAQTIVIAAPPSAGAGSWPYDPSYMRYLTLQGAGMEQTVITDNIDPNNQNLASAYFLDSAVAVFAKPGGLTRVTGFTFNRNLTSGSSRGVIEQRGTSSTWRVDHIHIVTQNEFALTVEGGASGGVVDHSTFDLVGWTFGIVGFNGGDGTGDLAWSLPSPAGTAVPYFVEDNLFRGLTMNTAAHDGYAGERVVLRNNSFINSVIAHHGLETSGRVRSARYCEVYNNNFIFTYDNFYSYAPLSLRGGNGVFFNNTVTGPSTTPPPYNTIFATYLRDAFAAAPWGASDGINPWDLNDPALYASGTHNGAASSLNTLVDTAQNWRTNQWVGYSVIDKTAGWGSAVLSNTGNTITLEDNGHGVNQDFNPGDSYEIRRVIAAPDQTGRGQGDLLADRDPSTIWTVYDVATGAASWPNQAPEQSYAWNNIYINSYGSNPITIGSQSYHIVENRDFFNGMPMPGYTPYCYPHPLVSGQPCSSTVIAMAPARPMGLAIK